MKMLKKNVLLILICLLTIQAKTQVLTQIVRGQIIDSESQMPVPFASISIITSNPLLGVVSDDKGYFRFEKVPIGRHNIQISCIGYETQLVPEVLVASGKEIILNIKLKEKITKLSEVTISAYSKKDKPLNNMATVSARTFSVEEARRYAGGFDDPGRLASSFAGVSTENSRDNSIVVRGNSPKGLLWRLEGVEIPNPNHFANMETFGGGGVSSLSALVVGNSDFFTGAFPAEYGNAVSGVFDIKLRTGNDENYEHAIQIGTMGIDLSSEGPLSKKTKASYLFNYRYSTLGLIKEVFPEEIKDFMPVYQDLCFKINIVSKNKGVFSVWGLASDDLQEGKAKNDSTLWEKIDDRKEFDISQRIGAVGFNHRYIFSSKTYINSSLALTSDMMKFSSNILGDDLSLYNNERVNNLNYKYTFTSVLNYKYSSKIILQTGVLVDKLFYKTQIKYSPFIGQDLITVSDENNNSSLFHYFIHSKININEFIVFNAGMRTNFFALNNELITEPRLGISYNFTEKQTISLAYGKHSRIEPLTLYFARVNKNNIYSQPNKNLQLAKSHHFVVAYDLSINPSLRLKVEPYIQYLTDVPVISDSSFSVLNIGADWYFNQELVNKGKGKNYGIDITLERFLKNGYYYLFTTTLFNSKYIGGDGVERNTRFNSNYVVNLLFGKEWSLGNKKNKILGVNSKISFIGGKRSTPYKQNESIIAEKVIYDYSQLYDVKESDKLLVNATMNFRINKSKYSSIWAFQVINLMMAKENYGLYYNYKTSKVNRWEFAVVIPNISYKIEF